ncbi:hypothetical protein VUR80DRAFT_10218 [Thermomyces stellatus]
MFPTQPTCEIVVRWLRSAFEGAPHFVSSLRVWFADADDNGEAGEVVEEGDVLVRPRSCPNGEALLRRQPHPHLPCDLEASAAATGSRDAIEVYIHNCSDVFPPGEFKPVQLSSGLVFRLLWLLRHPSTPRDQGPSVQRSVHHCTRPRAPRPAMD